jgi:three-Cys-motif partner protein
MVAMERFATRTATVTTRSRRGTTNTRFSGSHNWTLQETPGNIRCQDRLQEETPGIGGPFWQKHMASMRRDPLVRTEGDGLRTTSIRSWALDKYRLVSLYSRLFSTGMKRKWPARVYIDLFAGSGFSHIEETGQIYWGSPLLALGVPDPFDNFVFCERDPASLEALDRRVRRLFPRASVRIVAGDCNERIDEIARHIPGEHGVLSFCFADPYDLSLKFSSVRRLASRRVDFLFVLMLHLDANRNTAYYLRGDNPKIDEFVGSSDWRARWHKAERQGTKFPRFLADFFTEQMQQIGYLPVPFHRMKQIRSDVRNLPLYHLALFSRHQRAFQFWDEVLTYSTEQTAFDY